MAVDLQMIAIEHFRACHGPLVILVHCFGGMNRSSSALCALLIIFRKMSAKQAIATLVAARPGLKYWENRQYFVEALFDLHVQISLGGTLCHGMVGSPEASSVAL